ncbi:hypothetical protein LDG_7861 [Legionella drancourtii LLAP12]|uniref:Inositolphosphotransferase Aur1/Ipt1 domain-containing protein n=1 Tax=Legionella drancourtii LLAP12 TaxID=658187 RepID=G9ERE7_9GAMM|nr:hypothetical protein LDG_7861 [Legionella drancourtii LLAP12]
MWVSDSTLEKKSNPCRIGQELFYFFSIMSIIALATNAVQLTPFSIIDQQIVALEQQIHIDMNAIVRWTNNHPQFKYLLSIIYDSLTYQMSILPLIVILTCRFHLLREYYFFYCVRLYLVLAFIIFSQP